MIDHLSASQLNLYLLCSLKYKFQYVDKLPKPFKSSGLVFGSCVHSAMSWLHKQRMAGREVNLEQLQRIFGADWFANRVEAQIHYKQGESETNLQMMGRELLSQYFHMPANGVAGSEVPFAIPLVHPSNGQKTGVNFEGYIDLLENNDTVVEFKTSVRSMDQKDADEHLQLTAYSYAYERLMGRIPKLLKLIALVKTKKPKIVPLETKRTAADHQRFFYLAREVLHGIRSGVFFPKTSFMCTDCEYRKPCAQWSGG
jgi:putative RecB family exonuclease